MTSPNAIDALHLELIELLGDSDVTRDLRSRERASVDAATLSPIISEQLPLGLADLVAYPAGAEQIAAVLAAAYRHGVPVTPRGKGTGNYGQGIPLNGGLVLDLSRARAIVAVDDGLITAEAGATMNALEQAANAAGQQLWMYPSTAQSTIGGFLSGGSGGTGSITHGSNWMGFVTALDVALPDESPTLIHVEGAEAQTFVHTYGTAGVIARATVRLEPLQEWRSLYAACDDFGTAQAVLRQLAALAPAPRLVSADPAPIAAKLPDDAAIPPGRASLRAILDLATLSQAREMIEQAGGTVTDVRDGARHTLKLSMLSYNHPIFWLKRNTPDETWFHVEVGGDALIDRLAEVLAVYPEALLHIEAAHKSPIGMLTAPYRSAEAVYDGYPALQALGVRVHSPHQWYVDHDVEELIALKARTDPTGMLNPGKVGAPATVATGDSTASAQPTGHIMDQVAAEDRGIVTRLLAELSGPALAERLTTASIVVVPTGAIEHHGPHLPLATDQLIAEAIGAAAVDAAVAAGLDVWRLPTLAYTKSDEHHWAPGTVWLEWDTMFRTCLEIGRAVGKMGAGTLVFANGHGGNTSLLQVVLREIRKQYGLRTFLMPTLSGGTPPPGGEGLDEQGLGIHGGTAETSLVMHLRPELVDLTLAARWVPEHLADFELIGFNARPVSFGWLSDDFGTPGVVGDPTQATPAYGSVLFDASVAQATASLQEIARFSHRPPAR